MLRHSVQFFLATLVVGGIAILCRAQTAEEALGIELDQVVDGARGQT